MIKDIHILTAFISVSFFTLRFLWVMRDSSMMTKRWVKIVPHVNDTILLIAAIILAVSIQQYPFVHTWLTAKFIALILYIVFGMFALKRAKTKRVKGLFFVLAVSCFGYIVLVAVTRTSNLFI